MCRVVLDNSFEELLILNRFIDLSELNRELTQQVDDLASAFLIASLFRQMVDVVKSPLS